MQRWLRPWKGTEVPSELPAACSSTYQSMNTLVCPLCDPLPPAGLDETPTVVGCLPMTLFTQVMICHPHLHFRVGMHVCSRSCSYGTQTSSQGGVLLFSAVTILRTLFWVTTCCQNRPSLYWQLLWDRAGGVVENITLPLTLMLFTSVSSLRIFSSKHLIIPCGSLLQILSVFDIQMAPHSLHDH